MPTAPKKNMKFNVGGPVLFSNKNFRGRKKLKVPTDSLLPIHQGPYVITVVPPSDTYNLALPAGSREYNAFHVSLPKVHQWNDDTHFPSQLHEEPDTVPGKDEEECAVEDILGSRWYLKRLQYLDVEDQGCVYDEEGAHSLRY